MQVGQDSAVRLFKSNSFCTRCEEPSFIETLDRIISQVGQDNAIKLFSTDSFCTRCGNPSFVEELDRLVRLLGEGEEKKGQKRVTQMFSSGSFCKALAEEQFTPRFMNVLNAVGAEGASKIFNKDAISSRLCVDEFYDLVNHVLVSGLVGKQIVSVLGNPALNEVTLSAFINRLAVCTSAKDRAYLASLFIGRFYKHAVFRDAGVCQRLAQLFNRGGARPAYAAIVGNYVVPKKQGKKRKKEE